MYFVTGRVVFSAYSSVKKVRSNEGRCRVVPCLIFFLSDEKANDPDVSVEAFPLQQEAELPSLTADATSLDG